MAEKKPDLIRWLNLKFIDWQKDEGGRKTIIEFADYLDVNRSLLSYWMNGSREPSDENLVRLALKLGFEVYDLVGKKRPNPLNLYTSRNWDQAPEKVQRQIAELIAKYTTEPIPNGIKSRATKS